MLPIGNVFTGLGINVLLGEAKVDDIDGAVLAVHLAEGGQVVRLKSKWIVEVEQ